MKIGLRVEVATLQGALEGVPRLLKLFDEYQLRASFFFSLGADRASVGGGRWFNPQQWGYRRRTASLDLPKVGLARLFTAPPVIASRAADLIRSVSAAGHEVGIACDDRLAWLADAADAVYAGLPRYSLRVRNNDFRPENLQIGIDEAHSLGKQFFLAANIMPHGAKLKTFIDDMAPVIAMGPDALIMSDPGLILLVRERWPELPIHLSVQANTMNAAAVRFWQQQGLSRVILSRELSLEDVAEIRQACPEMEIEVFVHA